MITTRQEDYLKIIFDENLKQNKITNKFISDTLNIKAPSVSAMLNKLINDKLIVKNKKLGYLLTEEGEEITKHLLSKHRIWELFLIENLGYTWDEVHLDADKLEHVTSDNLLDKLNKFLGKPKKCPHGKPIYMNLSNPQNNFGEKMIDQEKDFQGKISIIEDNSELLVYLSNKGINLNDEFKLLSVNELDQSVQLLMDNKKVLISTYAASKIYVK